MQQSIIEKIAHRKAARPGNVLLEFALIATILFLLLAVILDFGRATFAAQTIEQAADHIARELADRKSVV